MTVAAEKMGPSFGRARVLRAWIVFLILCPLLWRAHRSIDGLLFRRKVSFITPAEVGAHLMFTDREREEASFGVDVELYRFLLERVPEDGVLSVWGASTDERRLLTLTFNAHLFPRRVDHAGALESYFLAHPDRLDGRVFVLAFKPADPLPDPWPAHLEKVFSSPRADVFRLRPEVPWR